MAYTATSMGLVHHSVGYNDKTVKKFVYSENDTRANLAAVAYFLDAVDDGLVTADVDEVVLAASDQTTLPGTISAAGTWTVNT